MSYDSQTSTSLINKLRKDVDSLTQKIALIEDRKASGTSGGNGVAATWTKRDLNTVASDPSGLILDLASSEFKLASGAYQIRVISPFHHTRETRMRVYDVTNSVVIGYSTSDDVTNQESQYIHTNVRIQPHKDTVYRLEYYITVDGATHLGTPASIASVDEIYTVCEVTRLDTGLTKPLGAGGLQGPQGPPGPTGPAGPAGPTGGGVTSVNVSGGLTGLSTSGGPITSSGTITLGGVVAVSAGGTNATTAAAALTSLGAYPATNPSGYTSNTGTVTSFGFTNANGVSGTVTNPTSTPNLTVSLGAITPTSVAASGTVTGSNLSGSNTGDQTITLTGDVTGSGTGSFAATIANNVVTYAKIQDIAAASRLLGRGAGAGAGVTQEISLGTGLSISGTTLSASAAGTVTSVDASGGTTGMSFSGGPVTTTGTLTLAGTLAVANGGTGATTAAGALTNLGAYPNSNPAGYTANVGTVTTTSVVTANGVSGTVANDSTTPAITIALNAITPTSVAASGTVTGSNISGSTSGTNTGDQTITLTGDVTGSGTGSFAATIANNAVTLAKFQQIATDRIVGRDTAGTGNVEQLTVNGGIEFTNAGGIQTSAFTGDVTKTAGGTAQTIANSAVTYAKIQDISAASKLLGRGAGAGLGITQEISLGSGLSMTGTTLSSSATGTVTSVAVSGGTTGLTTSGGPITTSGTITLAGTLSVANGGTSSTSAQSAINFLAGATTNGTYLRGNGTNDVMSAIQAVDLPLIALGSMVSGTLAVTNGGTGQSNVYTDGDLLIGKSLGGTLNRAKLTAGAGISVTNGSGTITIAATGSGTGDVVGPSNSTNGNFVLFDGATGKLIKGASYNQIGGDIIGPLGSTTMIDGFVYIPAGTAIPTGVPTNATGSNVPLYAMVSGATRRLYVYLNGTWRYSNLT